MKAFKCEENSTSFTVSLFVTFPNFAFGSFWETLQNFHSLLLNKIVIKCIRMMIFIVDISDSKRLWFIYMLPSPKGKKRILKFWNAPHTKRERLKQCSRGSKRRLLAMSHHDMCVTAKSFRDEMKSLFTFELVCRLSKTCHVRIITNVYSKGNCISIFLQILGMCFNGCCFTYP